MATANSAKEYRYLHRGKEFRVFAHTIKEAKRKLIALALSRGIHLGPHRLLQIQQFREGVWEVNGAEYARAVKK